MMALDTSSFVAYLEGETGPDVRAVDMAIEQSMAVFPPVVLSELLTDMRLEKNVTDLLKKFPLLTIHEGYWERAGLNRRKLLIKGKKAKLADTLIAQSCLDHDIALITRDRDFAPFSHLCGLKLF